MTAEERLEQLLNGCGQTLSDLPDYDLPMDDRQVDRLTELMVMLAERAGLEVPVSSDDMFMLMAQHCLRQTDIIDRMEWALDDLLHRAGKRRTEE